MRAVRYLYSTLIIALCLFAQQGVSQNYIPNSVKGYASAISVEIDPITYLLKGYSVHLRYQPAFSERLLVGAGSYALDLPDPLVNLYRLNRNRGWDVRIRSAWFLYGELYVREANRGWFIGEQVGVQAFKVANESAGAEVAKFSNVLFMTYIGYSWHPGKGSFYIKPWAGFGYTDKISGSNIIGSEDYDVSPLFVFLTFHLGYTF